jgi:hypothetical protein
VTAYSWLAFTMQHAAASALAEARREDGAVNAA